MDGCTYHRVHLPNQFIDADVRTVSQLSEEDLAWCDMLIYSRHTLVSVDYLNKFRDKYGFKIVVDTDDWWEAPKDHPKYEWWSRSNIGLQIRQHLMNADAVITTNERLAKEIPNPRVYIFPTMLPYGKLQFGVRKTKSDKVRLLYASTIMNYANTNLIAKAMERLSGLNIEIVIAGYHESPLFDILVSNLTAGKIPHRFINMKPAEEYMSAYEGDIMILPSKPSKFNSFKSNLKLLEAGALKMPVVVSKCDPYLGFPVNYFSSDNEFVEQVTKLVEDVEYRKKCGEELYKFCKYNYELTKSDRLKIYEEIL